MFANIPIKDEKRSLGGATVLTKEVLVFLKREKKLKVKHQQIRTFWKSKFQIFDFIGWVFKFPISTYGYDVISIHATKDMHFYFAPVLIFWLRILNKKYVYHCFAGNFHKQYDQKNKFHKKIIKATILKANTLFFETKEMVAFFSEKTKSECVWLPNSRKPQKIELKKFEKKFVFISRILPCKGIEELKEAIKQLPDEYSLDFYGPINNDYYSENYFENTRINYRGILKPTDVAQTIKKYDIMVLPTYCYGEGYPGTIIEALSVGKPVITTKFNSIPEIIVNNLNGKTVPIKDSNALYKAMFFFDEENYPKYVSAAIDSFDDFNSDRVFEKFTNSYINV